MRLYLAGPMTGQPEWGRPAFAAAAAQLRAAGHRVTNPGELPLDLARPWEDYLAETLWLILECQAVALLDGWEHSRGARLEVAWARRLGKPVAPVADWLALREEAAGCAPSPS